MNKVSIRFLCLVLFNNDLETDQSTRICLWGDKLFDQVGQRHANGLEALQVRAYIALAFSIDEWAYFWDFWIESSFTSRFPLPRLASKASTLA